MTIQNKVPNNCEATSQHNITLLGTHLCEKQELCLLLLASTSLNVPRSLRELLANKVSVLKFLPYSRRYNKDMFNPSGLSFEIAMWLLPRICQKEEVFPQPNQLLKKNYTRKAKLWNSCLKNYIFGTSLKSKNSSLSNQVKIIHCHYHDLEWRQ